MVTNGRERSLWRAVVGDGRPLLLAVAGALAFSGGFAIFLAASRQFLPHDLAHLGMSADDLCAFAGCRVVDFMVHDRVAWGATMLALAVMQTWSVLFPLSDGEAWAWWALVLSSIVGALGFLAYLGYGYLDTWHGLGTLLLLPVLVGGLALTRDLVERPRPGWWPHLDWRAAWRTDGRDPVGRALILMSAAGLVIGGLTILVIGATTVFVPQDLAFIGADAAALERFHAGLVPLIAHDRAGFGTAVVAGGILIAAAGWFARPARSLWQALSVAGGVAFGAAVVVHVAVGYTDPFHLAPAVAGATVHGLGCAAGARRERPPR